MASAIALRLGFDGYGVLALTFPLTRIARGRVVDAVALRHSRLGPIKLRRRLTRPVILQRRLARLRLGWAGTDCLHNAGR